MQNRGRLSSDFEFFIPSTLKQEANLESGNNPGAGPVLMGFADDCSFGKEVLNSHGFCITSMSGRLAANDHKKSSHFHRLCTEKA
jgi:hypothetical protein